MLRNKIIAIMALAVVGLASPTGASARGGGGGHGGGGFHGEEVASTEEAAFAAEGFTVADLVSAEAGFAGTGLAFSGHTSMATILMIMAATPMTAPAIWSPSES